MGRIFLRVRAPFAAFRWMQAGVYRATSPVIPPSAAWGLALNVAGVDTRGPLDGVTTLPRPDAPPLRIAVGTLREHVEVATLYQQLHSYPVGNSGKEWKDRSFGAKYWIAPARREVLVGLDAVVGVEGDDPIIAAIRAAVDGTLAAPRYGLLFAGDNNLLVDRIEATDEAPAAWWYERMGPGMSPRSRSCRLTVGIDRSDSSKTITAVFAPTTERASEPPPDAWTWAPREPT
jgi:CRISPR-associated protein Cas5t